MPRTAIALALFAVLTPSARSQDMPLSQILIDGEGWKKSGNVGDVLAKVPAITDSPDKKTVFQWNSGRYIEARQKGADDAIPSAPYCRLRTKRGEKEIEVTGLTTDKDGRIYAATEIGVQVFDPTGRLCGVLTPAAPGKPEFMAFDGDQLTVWFRDATYSRKLRTTAAK